jgi:hypothetical protein
MVDKVKPLKLEDTTSGGELNMLPHEADPSEDYVSVKGVAFENLDTHLAEKIGGVCKFTVPDCSQKPDFLANGEVNYVEFYESATQTTINRRVRVDMTYDGSLNPTTEVWKYYDPSDGTTVLRTITLTHTWSGVDLTKSTEVTT